MHDDSMLSYVVLSFFLGTIMKSLPCLLNLPAFCLIFLSMTSSQPFCFPSLGFFRLVLFTISRLSILRLSNFENSCSTATMGHNCFGCGCYVLRAAGPVSASDLVNSVQWM